MFMSTSIIASLFALAAAFTWGTGDFTGGLASRRIGPFNTLLISYFFGFAGLITLALIVSEPISSNRDLLWGAISGVSGLTGFLFLMHGFTVGRMGVVAPISAVLSAAIPVAYSAITDVLPSAVQMLGFAIAAVSIWLISGQNENSERPTGVVPALFAGIGFAGFFIFVDQIGSNAVFWPLVANRFTAISLMLIYAFWNKRIIFPEVTPLQLLIPAGLLDVIANVFFLRAVQTGRLDITAILVSLYPAITVLWARIFLGEQLVRLQFVGLGMAILSIALITI
jgi:drug/metabolite transporter (DMT)-like permease